MTRLERSVLALGRVRENLVLPSSASNAYVPVEGMADTLTDETLLSDGIAVEVASGRIFVACSRTFPRDTTPAMLRWWFCRGCKGSEEYRQWHPSDHFSCSWYRAQTNARGVEGDTHFVSEALGSDSGARPQTLRIQFKPLSTYGVPAELGDEVKLAARVGLWDLALGGWIDVGHFIHFTQTQQEGGFVLQSRFWLGDIDLPQDNYYPTLLKRPLRRLLNTRKVRSFAARFIDGRQSLFHLGLANYRHASEEFGVLATFLAEAFQEDDAQNDSSS